MLKPLPEAAVPWSDPRLRDAWIAIAIAAAMSVLLWPAAMINADEYLYAGQARLMLEGRLTWFDGAALPGGANPEPEGVRYPYGWPILLSFGALFGFRGMFVVPLLMHLMGGAIAARMLVRRGLPSHLAAVFLAHPLFWSFSRTLMSDAPTVVVILFAMDAWENRGRPALVGGALGYGFFMRFANAFSLAGFGIATLAAWRRRWRDLLPITIGGAAAGALLLVQNQLVSGHPLRSGYQPGSTSLVDGKMFFQHVVLYMGGLLLIPPFSLLAAIIRPRSCDRWALAALPVLGFFFPYSWHDESSRWLETLLGGQRLVLPAHLYLLMATASIWGSTRLFRARTLVLGAVVLGPLLHAFALRHLEERYRPAAEAVRSCEPKVVAYNRSAARVALASDAARFLMVDDGDVDPQADIAIVAFRAPTNRPLDRPIGFRLPVSLASRSTSCRQFGEFYLFDLRGGCRAKGNPCDYPPGTLPPPPGAAVPPPPSDRLMRPRSPNRPMQ